MCVCVQVRNLYSWPIKENWSDLVEHRSTPKEHTMWVKDWRLSIKDGRGKPTVFRKESWDKLKKWSKGNTANGFKTFSKLMRMT